MRNIKNILLIFLFMFLAGFIMDNHGGASNRLFVSKDSIEKKIYFKIIGLPFNRSVAKDIYKILSKQSGVIECAVNFETATVRLKIDSYKTDSFKLSEAIERYDADGDSPRYHAVEMEYQ